MHRQQEIKLALIRNLILNACEVQQKNGPLLPEAARKPQEIDGKGSENLPLCRNRVVRISQSELSRKTGRGASLNRSALHRAQTIPYK